MKSEFKHVVESFIMLVYVMFIVFVLVSVGMLMVKYIFNPIWKFMGI